MNDDTTSNSSLPPQRTWLEKLSQVLLREPQDRKQLISLLHDAQSRDLLDSEALRMIEGVLHVSEMQVRDIMVPRAQMVTIESDASLKEFLPIVVDSAHSRFPVLGENDEVIGILLAKDLLVHAQDTSTFNCRNNMRAAVFVPESKRLDTLLKEFRLQRNHMAIVVDEYGHNVGLVTIEDILEQIVGNIEDEYDVDEAANIQCHSDTHFTIQALTSIEEFNEYFNTNFSDNDFDTIGGLVTQQFGHVPKRGETTTVGDFDFKVLRADNRRVHVLQVMQKEPAAITGTQ